MLSRRGIFDSEGGPSASAVGLVSGAPQITFNSALRVWWAYYWPTSVISFVFVAIVAFWLGIFAGVSFPARFLLPAIRFLPYIVSYTVAFFVIHYILAKRFRNFRVALLPTDAAAAGDPVRRTFRRTIRVWWAFSWRAFIYSLVATLVATIPLGFLLGAINLLGKFAAETGPILVKTAIGGLVGLYVFYSNILGEEFGDFRVCLVPLEKPWAAPAASLTDGRVGTTGESRP